MKIEFSQTNKDKVNCIEEMDDNILYIEQGGYLIIKCEGSLINICDNGTIFATRWNGFPLKKFTGSVTITQE